MSKDVQKFFVGMGDSKTLFNMGTKLGQEGYILGDTSCDLEPYLGTSKEVLISGAYLEECVLALGLMALDMGSPRVRIDIGNSFTLREVVWDDWEGRDLYGDNKQDGRLSELFDSDQWKDMILTPRHDYRRLELICNEGIITSVYPGKYFVPEFISNI